MIRTTLRLRIGNFRDLKKHTRGFTGPMRSAATLWVNIYTHFMYNRFQKFSRGRGNWKKLSPKYVKRKKKQGFSTRILVRTGILERQLDPSNRQGKRVTIRAGHVDVEYAPSRKYPNGTPVKEILTIHDQGLGIHPRRTVLAKFPKAVANQMAKVTESQGLRPILDRPPKE